MQYSFTAIVLFSLGCNIAHSTSLIARHVNPGVINNVQGIWEADASIVSRLSTAESLTVATLANATQATLNTEND
jgi:hypothetical protein